jgi:4-hydroxy-tetrahydrodipicolinate reductase
LAGVSDIHVPLTPWLEASAQAMIDFSIPEAATAVTRLCMDRKIPLVMATTGLTKETKELLAKAAERIPVVYSPSMSTSVNLAMRLVAKAAEVLRNAPSGADVEIIERHHRMKEDSPSGTALRFGEIVAAEMGITQHRHGRQGQVGKRPRNTPSSSACSARRWKSRSKPAAATATPWAPWPPPSSSTNKNPACTACTTCWGCDACGMRN